MVHHQASASKAKLFGIAKISEKRISAISLAAENSSNKAALAASAYRRRRESGIS